MKIYVCRTGACRCHPEGMLLALAFNRGHAVKLMNKQLEDASYGPLPRDEKHLVEEIDPSDPVYKKGYAELSWRG